MKMKAKPYDIVDVPQGSPEWLQMRYDHITASQVPTLFNVNPYQKREALLVEKITRQEKEENEFKQVLFERAHKAEAVCREYVEKEFSSKFPPAVIVSRKCPDLLASLDGFDSENKVIFEAKYMGEKSLTEVEQGIIKPHHMCQIQAQLYASGAEKCIYFALDQTGKAAFTTIWPDKVYQMFIPKLAAEFMEELKKAKGV